MTGYGLFLLILMTIGFWGYSLPAIGAEDGKVWEDAGDKHKPYIDPTINRNMTELVKNTLPAVVSIATEQSIKPFGQGSGDPMEKFFEHFFNQPYGRQFKQEGLGSGFLISPEGYLLTNNHVIENADEIKVQLHGGDEYKAKVVGRDSRTDMALLKIETGKPLPYLVLGDSDDLEIGHMVIAMGNPFGLSHTVTSGIVSQKGRKDINPSGRHIIANFIQTDASINPGNSGGPLLNIYGEVVGINTAIAQGQGIGFAIPISMSKTLLPQLTSGSVERSWIGIQVQPVTSELAESLGLSKPKGALVSQVIKDSPAEKAGLLVEDVILKFNGKSLENQADLIWMASTAGIGAKVKLLIWRNRSEKTVTLKLGRMPERVAGRNTDPSSKNMQVTAMGISVIDPATEQLENLAITDGYGVMVAKVDPASAAARTGVRPGDVIRKVNRTIIKNAKHFEKVSGKLGKGKTVRLLINRNKMALFVAFTIK